MTHSDPTKQSKRYLENFAIPAIDLIPDKRNYTYDDNGKKVNLGPGQEKGGTTWIACVPGEKSIYVDEQTDKQVIHKLKRGEVKIPKLQFTEGRRLVEDHNKIEYEYLLHCRHNIKNAPNNRIRTFFEFKPAEISKQHVQKEIEDISIKSEILGFNLSKLKAVARVSGAIANMRTFDNTDPDIIKHSLIVKASTPDGRKLIKEVMEDAFLEYKFDVYEGIDRGFLKWQPTNEWNLLWSSGGVVCNVPAGTQDKVTFVAEYLFHKGLDTLNTIRKMLGRSSAIEDNRDEDQNTEIREWLKGATPSQVIDRMLEWDKENKQYNFFEVKGAYYFFGDKQLSTKKGKDGLKEALLSDNALYQVVYEKWISLVLPQ